MAADKASQTTPVQIVYAFVLYCTTQIMHYTILIPTRVLLYGVYYNVNN